MRKCTVIARKECSSFFRSPAAYIVLILTFCVFNIFFYLIIEQGREASLRDMFKVMEFMFLFVVPLLTMRLIAEERRSGTLELLKCSPVTTGDIVLGKFTGALLFFLCIVLFTLSYYGIIEYFARPDRAAILSGYAGIVLEGALFLAIGLYMSSLTRNQLVAAITTYVLLFLVYFSISYAPYIPAPAEGLIRHIAFWGHTEHFASGFIALSDIVYFLSGILFFLVLTYDRLRHES